MLFSGENINSNGAFFYCKDSGIGKINGDSSKCIIPFEKKEPIVAEQRFIKDSKKKHNPHLTLQKTIELISYNKEKLYSPYHYTAYYVDTEKGSEFTVHIYFGTRLSSTISNTIITCKNETKQEYLALNEEEKKSLYHEAKDERDYLGTLITKKDKIVDEGRKKICQFEDQAFCDASLEKKLENVKNHLNFLTNNPHHYRYTDHPITHEQNPKIAELMLEKKRLEESIERNLKNAGTIVYHEVNPSKINPASQPQKKLPATVKILSSKEKNALQKEIRELNNACFLTPNAESIQKMINIYHHAKNVLSSQEIKNIREIVEALFRKAFSMDNHREREKIVRIIFEAFKGENTLDFFSLCDELTNKEQSYLSEYLYQNFEPYKHGVDLALFIAKNNIKNSVNLETQVDTLITHYKRSAFVGGKNGIKNLLDTYLCELFDLKGVKKILEVFSDKIDFSECYANFLKKVCMDKSSAINQHEAKIVKLLNYIDTHAPAYPSVLRETGATHRESFENQKIGYTFGLLAGTVLNDRLLIFTTLLNQGLPKNAEALLYSKPNNISLNIVDLITIEKHFMLHRDGGVRYERLKYRSEVWSNRAELAFLKGTVWDVHERIVNYYDRIPALSLTLDRLDMFQRELQLSARDLIEEFDSSEKMSAILLGISLSKQKKMFDTPEKKERDKRIREVFDNIFLKKERDNSFNNRVKHVSLTVLFCCIGLLIAAKNLDKIMPLACLMLFFSAYKNRDKIVSHLSLFSSQSSNASAQNNRNDKVENRGNTVALQN